MRHDDDEFTEFARARTPALFHAARLMCGDAHTAEDLVQETLAKVYLVWGKKRIDNPAAYAHTTLLRTFISIRRRRMSGEYPVEFIPDWEASGPDSTARIDLMAALGALSPSDRAVLVARYLEDCSIDEIAHALHKNPSAVRRQASRALEKLRAVVGARAIFEGEESE